MNRRRQLYEKLNAILEGQKAHLGTNGHGGALEGDWLPLGGVKRYERIQLLAELKYRAPAILWLNLREINVNLNERAR